MLPLARYRARFVAADSVSLSPFPGPVWRGAFGNALKQVVCVTRLRECPPCLLYRSCPYSYVFETPPPLNAEKMRKYPAAPHPFALEVEAAEQLIPPGEKCELGFTLFGRGNQYLPYVVYALERVAERGLGPGKGKLQLVSVLQEQRTGCGQWDAIYAPEAALDPFPPASPVVPELPATLRFRLQTPLRLKGDGTPLGVQAFAFGPFFSNLLRRVSMLTYFHTDTPLDTDFAALTRSARGVVIREARLAWSEQHRHSSRQGREIPLGGLVGEFTVEGRDAKTFWPILWLGQYTHAGAAAVMGLGAYRIEPASLRAQPVSPSPCETIVQ